MKLVSSRSATEDDFVRLAQAYADVESLQDALHWLTKAIELHPAGGELLHFKANILERSGRLEEALQTARAAQAAGADPDAISCDIKRISDHLTREWRERIKSPDAVQALTSYLGLCRTQICRSPGALGARHPVFPAGFARAVRSPSTGNHRSKLEIPGRGAGQLASYVCNGSKADVRLMAGMGGKRP